MKSCVSSARLLRWLFVVTMSTAWLGCRTEQSPLKLGAPAKPEAPRGLGVEDEAATDPISRQPTSVDDAVLDCLIAFDSHLRAGDPEEAERELRVAIAIDPYDPRGHRALAQLLDAEGRRLESREHLIAVEHLVGMSHLEALSLVDLGGPFYLVDFQSLIDISSPSVFDLGKIRLAYGRGSIVKDTLEKVDELRGTIADTPALEAFLGRLIAESTDGIRLTQWLEDVPPGIDQHAEYWFAVGVWLSREQRDQEAIRAFAKAIRLDPTDRRSLTSLAAVLDRLGEVEKAQSVQQTLGSLETIFRIASKANAAQSLFIAEQMQLLTRPWEALAWYRHALELQGQLEQRHVELQQRRQQIEVWQSNASDDHLRDVRTKKMLGFDFTLYPLPELKRQGALANVVEEQLARSDLRFHDVAELMGVSTNFFSGYPDDGQEFYLYQANGGGIAAFDFDLDGRCDLYFVQSGGNPNIENDSVANQLYRHVSLGQFVDVTGESNTGDRGFGQGVCAADINQDGFLDLAVGNIGKNSLYLNQGDGTFRDASELIADNFDRWTSSIAVGDLDGDALPDLVEVNYLDDPTVFEAPCRGRQLDCTPQRFRAAPDRILKNDGQGNLQKWPPMQQVGELANYGFGAVLTNFDAAAGNDLFISNDGDLNHYWKSRVDDQDDALRYVLSECASITGCSVGRTGYSQACMGIAAGDFDHNGLLDLFVTNFHKEPVNLFLQNASGFFVDEAMSYALVEPSVEMLGFGAQAADFDNDGWLDVAVLNGHIYDASYAGIPYRMPAQLFRGKRGGFTSQDPNGAGPYWQRPQLGRTLALLDIDRDGRMDLVASHLDQPFAILKNDSEAKRWLQLDLVGVASERSAVGTRVVVHSEGEHWSAWRTGGNGYMCSNESVIHIGLGNVNHADQLEIHWPSGHTQSFDAVGLNQRYLVIEGGDLLNPGR